ncbi:MAG: TRAP transporter large permease subunit, partial [Rhodobacteraceae bacterium]|nr:TRAP transporter large permease subunit [Paracoccaceae bacterium]
VGMALRSRNEALTWFLFAPAAIILGLILAASAGIVGGQSQLMSTTVQDAQAPELRTNVSPQCQAAMIELHGQEKWDRSASLAEEQAASGTSSELRDLTEDEVVDARASLLANTAPIGSGVATLMVLFALALALGRGVDPGQTATPLAIGAGGVGLGLIADAALISPIASPGATFAIMAVPTIMALYGVRVAAGRLAQNELVRVVFPPLVLIIAVLGSILGGITNPTPAAALGAGGAIMLAAYRRLKDENGTGKIVIWASFAVVIMILLGINFDLRPDRDGVSGADWVAIVIAQGAYHAALFGLLYSCWVLFRTSVLSPVVRETAKVTSMVFTILIGSQLLNLVVISFGGEHYIQQFLRSFDNELVVFLIVMLVLFILGFVLDFLEIIYIVIPIVGPVIYGGTMDPKWVTIMIAVNLQTSFLTPPFGFALFYLRGVAPAGITTGHIYRGVLP